jgi:long-chain acyl-CoA synthetase
MLLNDFLEENAFLFPQKTVLVCQGSRYSFFEINKAANSFGSALIGQGFQKQDRGIIYLENSYQSVISIFGILKASGIFVVINPAVKPRKLGSILSDSGARVLITDLNRVRELYAAKCDLPDLKCIVVTDPDLNDLPETLNVNIPLVSFNKMVVPKDLVYLPRRCIDIDLACLIYTSGSSGIPKGVMLTHRNMISAIYSITQYLKNQHDDIIINTLPLSFDYGLYQVFMAVKFGGTVILERGFVFPEQIINTVVEEKVTGWPMVPTIAAILCRLKNLEKHDFSHLRYITSTGQVLPTNHIARLQEAFPDVRIYSMYGLTECKRVSYLPPEELDKRPGSVGKPMPNTEAYIVNDAGEEINEAGVGGELVIRGSNVMQGYWHNPELTDKVLRPGRYPGERVLHTGDIFKKDEEGYLYFLGRKDDIIKTSGHMVSPKEIEDIICRVEDVIEAAVIGVPDDILGQAVKAYVHLSANSRSSERDILSFCYKNLEDYAVPRYIQICGPLPKSENGKIQKQGLQ